MKIEKRIALIVVVSIALVFLFTLGCFKKTPKTYHVGILSGLDFFSGITDGFKEKMAELGYIEGQNIVYDVQKTNVDTAVYRNILKKFVADKVDLILAFPTEASMEAKSAANGTGIPVVFVNVFTENTDLIKSIREPGGNITGVRWAGPDMALKNLEFMRELVPHAKLIFIPYMKDYPIVYSQLEALRQVFKASDLKMIEIPARNAAELQSALKEQSRLKVIPDAVLTIAEPLCVTPDSFIVMAKFADEHKIPIGGGSKSMGTYESVFTYIPQSVPQGKQAAFLADKILKGTPAGTIPVVSAECYLTVNYRATKKLGIKVSEGLMSVANEIVR